MSEKRYENFALYANADELLELSRGLKKWSRRRDLPALTVQFNNVPAEIADEMQAKLNGLGFCCEPA